ncbi:MAG: winged helix-turn-helix transcriptional regulator [Rhizobiales bacterium]|nr:winged helix-turn-helix transcriptional regulator [Hyphomicrobiales bacterium]
MASYRDIGNRCIALHLRRAARQVGRLYDDALRSVGINNGQFSLMAMLAAKDDWTMQELADALGLDQSSLSAAIKPLMRRQLLVKELGVEDARVRKLRLTSSGQRLLDEAQPLWRIAQDKAEALLGDHEPAALRSALRTLG